MCGISGIFLKNSNLNTKDIDLINLILDLQNNRGPDFRNSLKFNRCILGHNRLKIIDLSKNGNQPMETEKYSIVFNGEIYNYIQLKKELPKTTKFKGNSDTEVLLKLFEFYGIEETLKKINGMYAIAVYDKILHKLYLIRDRLGQKPLYYYNDEKNERFYFASNLKSIFYSLYKIYGKVWDINYKSIYHYLLLGGCWEGQTIINNIYKLENASYIEIDKSFSINKKKYWIPKYSSNNFNDLLNDSIRLRHQSDVPLSILFSGGIDSSILAYYSVGANCIHLCNGEEEYAKEISKKLDVNIDLINTVDKNIGINKLKNYLKNYIKFSGEPSMACIIPMLTLDDIKKKSTVILSGNGGDELCYGYDRTPTLIEDIIVNISEKDKYKYTDKDYQLLHIFRHPQKIKVKNVKSYTFEEFKKYIYNDIQIDSSLSKHAFYRYLEFNTYVKNDLNPTLDYSSMYYSLEVRCPFLDYRVIESGLSKLPNEHIYSNKLNKKHPRKKLLKEILSNKLDSKLYNRNKLGFSLPNHLSKSYRDNVGNTYLKKIIDRGIIESINYNLGIYSRDLAYLRSSCIALEEWLIQYVDTKIIKM